MVSEMLPSDGFMTEEPTVSREQILVADDGKAAREASKPLLRLDRHGATKAGDRAEALSIHASSATFSRQTLSERAAVTTQLLSDILQRPVNPGGPAKPTN